MTIWFKNSSSENKTPLPSDYIRSGGSVGDECTVLEVIQSQTGLLLVGTKFKGMLFRSKPVHDLLLAALEQYLDTKFEAPELIIRINESHYVDCGANYEFAGYGLWTKDGNRYRFRTEPVPSEQSANPFLDGSSGARSESGALPRKPRQARVPKNLQD